MPLSPRHALLLHDGSLYTLEAANSSIKVTADLTVTSLNELQWLNAYQNVYFPPSLSDEQISRLVVAPRTENPASCRRLESTGEAGTYRSTYKDEFSAPAKGATREMVHFSTRELLKDIRIKGVSIRSKSHYHDDGSMASPLRDPAWCQITQDFASAVEQRKWSFADFWLFASEHHLIGRVGPWLGRVLRGADTQLAASK